MNAGPTPDDAPAGLIPHSASSSSSNDDDDLTSRQIASTQLCNKNPQRGRQHFAGKKVCLI